MRLQLPHSPELTYLVGNSKHLIDVTPLPPYSDLACSLLNQLSRSIFSDNRARDFPDLIAFAYWCRTANIIALKTRFDSGELRQGRGVIFHVAPGNVPMSFAFSYAFSLLAGNLSIVKVPSKEFPQINLFLGKIRQLLDSQPRYQPLKNMSFFVKYHRGNAITEKFSALCNVRVIWGGDQAIAEIRRHPIPPRSFDVTFSDRYSFCAINAKHLLQVNDAELKRIAAGFNDDVFTMDQNACSSPHLVVWLGNEEEISSAKDAFWKTVYSNAQARYQIEPIHALDKFVSLCSLALTCKVIKGVERHANTIYRILIDQLPDNIELLRGKYGLFFEFHADDLNCISHIVNEKFQTLTYFGLIKHDIERFITSNALLGIDRVVPIGQALNIGTIWDGYDIIRTLSRVIEIK